MTPPAFAHWKFYLPSTYGRWARSGDEITIRDASNKEIYFSLRQANKMSGHAFHKLSFTGRHQFPTEWKRVPKPLPVSSVPPIWYGLAIAGKGGTATGRVATAIALSDSDWFTFYMPSPTTGTFRGYSWTAAFVLLTGYLDRGDCIAHPGSSVDYELSLGRHWFEQAGALNRIVRFSFEDAIQFAFKNAETLRTLGLAAVEGTCIDYDEKHVIIGDLSGTEIGSGIYAYTGECVQSG